MKDEAVTFINFWDCTRYKLQVYYNHDNLRSSPKSVTKVTQACPGVLLVGALPGAHRLADRYSTSGRNSVHKFKTTVSLVGV